MPRSNAGAIFPSPSRSTSGARRGRLIRRSGRSCQPGGSPACSGAPSPHCASRPTSGPFSCHRPDRSGRRFGHRGSGSRRDGDDRRDFERTARRRGAVGVICDGAIRDVATLAQWADFSCLHASCHAARPLVGRAWRGQRAGGVRRPRIVRPGDLLIGDDDGLVALDADAIRSRIGDAEAKLQPRGGMAGEPRRRPVDGGNLRTGKAGASWKANARGP